MKILYVATVQSHIAQFHLRAIDMLKEKGYEIHVAARDNLAEKNGLRLRNVDRVINIPFERSPFKMKNIRAYRQLKQVITQEKYDMIHCNTPVGGILTRLAANKSRKNGTVVIYMAHGFHFYKGAPLKNWLVFYPIEKFMSGFTSRLVTITEEDFQLARRKFKCSVYRIHGVGANSEKYGRIRVDELDAVTKRFNLEGKFVLLCTGELNQNKNQKTLIEAMKMVSRKIPNSILLLAGNGPAKDELEEQIRNNNLQAYVKLLGYVTDLEKYVHLADVIISASYREGLPLNIVEAMYCKKPVVASVNRGHKELIKDGIDGYLVPAADPAAFADKIVALAKDPALRSGFGQQGYIKAQRYMDINVLQELKEVYEIK